ncbi:hypothetical protein GUJ93_ZPchr0004g39742 [Zizania palustris]|uniref:Uncharacterized protein n=1 Tax=Zizania palustris TaxID=103762 RepID=A0A8J5V8W9_ZIZPA|nr:hypothetical protein GUJ93_ZPchr0004g39742 [Zizania palustris]
MGAVELLEFEGRFTCLGLLRLLKSALGLEDLQSRQSQAGSPESHRLDGGRYLEVLACDAPIYRNQNIIEFPKKNNNTRGSSCDNVHTANIRGTQTTLLQKGKIKINNKSMTNALFRIFFLTGSLLQTILVVGIL